MIWSSLLFGATQQESLSLYAQVSQDSVALKWLRLGYSNTSHFKVYRAENGAKEKLLATVRPATYEWLKDKAYDDDYLFFIYPFHDVKTAQERLDVIQSQEMRDSFRLMKLIADNQFAKNSGCFYRDETVQKGTKYRYRVEELNPQGHLLSNTIKITGAKALKNDRVMWVQAFDEHSSIALNFDTATGFGFYNIYRKLPAQSKFKRLNKRPRFVSVVDDKDKKELYHDRQIALGQHALYYVTKVNMFGVEGPASPQVKASRTVATLMPDRVERLHIVNGDKKIIIHWKKVSNAVSYDIYRSKIYQEGFKKLNQKPISNNVYSDKNFTANTNYYYYVVATNMHGSAKPSSKFLAYAKDTTPPSRPTALSYELKQAQVTLRWKPSQDKNFLGYRVYIAMDKEATEWSMVTKEAIQETLFNHQRPKRLSRHPYYYKITAVDTNFNESKASNIITVQLQDVIAPEQPTLNHFTLLHHKIQLQWNKVRVYDLASYNVYRAVDKHLVKLNTQPLTQTLFVDENPKQGLNHYIITAVDQSGNESEQTVVTTVMAQDTQPVTLHAIKVVQEKNGIALSFKVDDADYNGFEIMRSSGNDRHYYNISSFQKGTYFLDTTVSKKEHYFYTIKAYDKVGNIVESAVFEIKVKG